MSAQGTITINDGQSTPVAKNFSARGADLQLALWKDVSAGIAIGMPTITISNRQVDGSNGNYRVEARISVPTLEVISGSDGGYTPAPKIAYKDFAKVELIAHSRSTLQNRKDLLAFTKNLLAHAVMSETFVDFNPAN